jgi:hypothetical protein
VRHLRLFLPLQLSVSLAGCRVVLGRAANSSLRSNFRRFLTRGTKTRCPGDAYPDVQSEIQTGQLWRVGVEYNRNVLRTDKPLTRVRSGNEFLAEWPFVRSSTERPGCRCPNAISRHVRIFQIVVASGLA